jgi:ribosome biogenesis protein SSF1/2
MNNFLTPADKVDPENPDSEIKRPPVPRHLESLVTTIFQSLFPPVAPQTMPLSSVKRVLLLNREPPSDPESSPYTITLRHYAITTKSRGLPKVIKRINNAEKVHKRERKGKGLPNLGQLEDVADYILDPETGNYTSASESEADTDAEVEILAQQTRKLHYKDKLEKKRARSETETGESSNGVEKRAIKLTELGPRLKLRLVKVEEGMGEGKVMWHEYFEKSKEEQEEMEGRWETRRKEKEERKKIQKANIEKKKKEKRATRKGKDNKEDEDEEMDDYEDWDDDLIDAYAGAMDEDEDDEEDEDEAT